MKWDRSKGVLYSDDGEKLGVISYRNNTVEAKSYVTGKKTVFPRWRRAREWLEEEARKHGK